MRLICSGQEFNETPSYTKALNTDISAACDELRKFNQEGYELTFLERCYFLKQKWNNTMLVGNAIEKPWLINFDIKPSNLHINHSFLYERKAFDEEAREELLKYSSRCIHVHKLLQLKAKWGIDLSIDYVDSKGNVFELIHYEFDSFDLQECIERKKLVEDTFLSLSSESFEILAAQMKERADEWYYLDYAKQSDWKCQFFNLPSERWKTIAWKFPNN